jgi:type I restriction enzyme S subunit
MNNAMPVGWAEKELGEILTQVVDFRGRTPKKLGLEWGGGNIPALSANNVQMGKVDFSKECYLASEELYGRWMTKGSTAKDDILFTMEAPLGNVALVPDNRKYILSQRVVLLKADRHQVHSRFLFQQLRSDSFRRQLRENSTGSTALGIQQKRLVQLIAIIPTLCEQQKIATILTAVDDAIESTQAQISKLKDLKTGMMQELLAKGIGHTKFKDSLVGNIPANWDVATIGDVFNMASGSTPSRKDATYFSNSGDSIPWVKTMDLHDGLITTTNEKITQRAIDETSCKLLPIGTTLLAMYGGWNQIGRSGVLGIQAATNQAICALIPKDKIGGSFCNYWMISKRWVWKAVAASSRKDPNITKQDVQEFLIAIPPTAEQDEIVKRLDSATILISAKEEKLSHLRDIKMALMQDLLTGKVRVNVN